ncbi:MAG: DUF502 domain-containing protein [Dehalococcoidales bacterium]|nr:DUF502 domain-containing protein [Dehalococcoidales bacterium]
MKHNLTRSLKWFTGKIGMQFFEGVITIVPIAAIVWILIWSFRFVDDILQPVINRIWGHTITGAGIGITILLIYLVGVIASNVIGKWLIRRGESLLPWMPVVRQIYTGIKQVLQSFRSPHKTRFMYVVLLEYPRKGLTAMGFVTNELDNGSDKKMYTVFVPTSPNPTSGFLQIVGEDEITRTNISVENALKMIVSAGRVLPKEVNVKLSAEM